MRNVAARCWSTCAAPGLVADEHGWVVAVAGMPNVERVAVPRAGLPVAVLGAGIAWPAFRRARRQDVHLAA